MLFGYLLFVTLNVIDLFLTKVILENGGKEWNFIARFFYKHLGIKGIAWLKLVVLSWFGIQYYFKVLDLYEKWTPLVGHISSFLKWLTQLMLRIFAYRSRPHQE
jgi:hypothetical protein